MRSRVELGFLVLWLMGLGPCVLVARAAVVAAPGYAVHAIATPGIVQGGVIRRGTAVLVGQGAFGVGTETIIRLDGTATTVATGFNSLGGFDLDASGTLYVVDNGGAQPGAVTGNTLFAIVDALTRSDAVTASGHEVVPAGTIPSAQDVLVAPGGAVLVTDAVGPGVGRVVHVQGGVATNLIMGLDYAAGLALRPDGTLIVGDLDAMFTGMVFLYGLDGTRTGTLASGLSGDFDEVVDSDGNVLVSGGKTADASSSTVIAIAPDGTISERAHGFMFSTEMYFDAARDELLVLDTGATAITAICRDRDGNGVCDADQATTTTTTTSTSTTTTATMAMTRTPCMGAVVQKPRLTIGRLTRRLGHQTLQFTGAVQLPGPLSPPLDPISNGMRILVSDAAGTIADATIPGGGYTRSAKAGWRMKRSGSAWTYRNNAGGVLGIVRVGIKTVAGTPSLLEVKVKGRNGPYAVPRNALPVTLTLVLDAPAGATGQCAEAIFAGAPALPCAFRHGGAILRCR